MVASWADQKVEQWVGSMDAHSVAILVEKMVDKMAFQRVESMVGKKAETMVIDLAGM